MKKLLATLTIALALTTGVSLAGEDAAEGYKVKRFKTTPRIDGDLKEWSKKDSLEIKKANVDDLEVKEAKFGWDKRYLYVIVQVKDHTLLNEGSGMGIAMADCMELRICMDPKKGNKANDTLLISPTSSNSKAACVFRKGDDDPKVITSGSGKDETKIKWAVKTTGTDWTAEAAIPLELLGIEGKEGTKIPFTLVIFDRDRKDVDEWAVWHKRNESSNKKAPPDEWPTMTLEK
ncbi:MAG: hypothetical protein JXR97_13750 [Planctomycetes bacterium]|nr:hypothetical protein [Planctomycetota bacterium]